MVKFFFPSLLFLVAHPKRYANLRQNAPKYAKTRHGPSALSLSTVRVLFMILSPNDFVFSANCGKEKVKPW